MPTPLTCRACQAFGTPSNPHLWDAADHQTVLCAACARWAHLAVPPCPPLLHVYTETQGVWTCNGCSAWYLDASATALPKRCPGDKHPYVPTWGGQWTCPACGQALTSQALPILP